MGMRSAHDPYGSPAVLVDHMLGNSYEVVRYVAKNIEFVKHVSGHMVQIYRVDASLTAIEAVSENLTEIEAILANIDNMLLMADSITNVNSVADNMTAVLGIFAELQKLLDLHAQLNKLMALSDNLPELMELHGSLAQVLNVNEHMTQLLAIDGNMEELTGLYTNLTALVEVHSNLTQLLGLHAYLPKLDTLYTNLTMLTGISDEVPMLTGISDELTVLEELHTNLPQFTDIWTNMDDLIEAAAGLTNGFTKVEIEGGAATDIVFPTAIAAALVVENGQVHVSGSSDRFTVSGPTITPVYPWAAGTIVALGFRASKLTEMQIDGTFGLRSTVGGTANALTIAINASVTTLVTGLAFTIWPSVANTGAVTMNVNGLGAVAAKTITGATMPAGYLRVGLPTRCWYDGTQFIVDRLPEIGSNANGIYRRYADGRQECTYTMTGVDVTTAVGGIYKSAPQTWEFPMPFVYSGSVGEVFLSGRLYSNVGMGVNIPYGNRTTQAGDILAYATASVTGTTLHLSATGPWY